MNRLWTAIPIQRTGMAVPGSPFPARLFLTRSLGRRHEIIPDVIKAETARVLVFQDPLSDIRVGDVALLPDGSMGKVVDVRRWSRTLQCELQIVPFGSAAVWMPDSTSARINTTIPGGIQDGAFHTVGVVLAYLEPNGDQTSKSLIGRWDIRSARCYSTTALSAGAVLRIGTDAWHVPSGSEYWAVTNDFVATVHWLTAWPVGVV